MLTILPDYLYRRFYQGKEWGREITLFSVWYELRWGITACIMLTILLITVVFYNHPATSNVVSFFRTVPILPDTAGRVSEVYVNLTDEVTQGDKLFKLDSSKQEAALETSKRRVEEVDAAMEMAKSEVAAAKGQIQQAQGALQQAIDELRTKRSSSSVMPASSPHVRSKGSRWRRCAQGTGRGRQMPDYRQPRHAYRHFFQQKRPAPRPPSTKRRSPSTKRSSTRASTAT